MTAGQLHTLQQLTQHQTSDKFFDGAHENVLSGTRY
jgi:hypothetical protein